MIDFRCSYCDTFLSPNKFIFHSHRLPNVTYVQPDSPNFNAWRRHLRLHNPTQSEELRDAWEDVKAMFNGGNRKRSSSGPISANSSTNKSSTIKDDQIEEKVEIDVEEQDDLEEINDEIIGPKKRPLDHEQESEKVHDETAVAIVAPQPTKVSRSKGKEKKIATHNVVSSTTADEQISDMNMFLPLPTVSTNPTLPSLATNPYFPFISHLSSTSSFPLVTMNTNDWLQFFRSPLMLSNPFRSPFGAISRRFPFDFSVQSNSILGNGSQSAFKPPIQKND